MPTLNRLVIFAILVSSLLLTSFSTGNRAPKYQIRTIVIDPGHGGHDTGCLGSSSREKNIALAVSLKLGELIKRQFPDINVIFTRKTDVFVELHERAAIANRNKADLFICIHCNSGPSAAFGAETFVMGLHKSASNLEVAKRENSAILLEKDYKTKYEGFDPNSPEANIIFSLYQNTFMNQSLLFASHLQDEFEHNSGRFNRGVKQAGFLVLFKTAMPSVLIELGFLTNKTEEKFLISDNGQEKMAGSILNAFSKYKKETERKAGGTDIQAIKDEVPTSDTTIKPVADEPLAMLPPDTEASSPMIFYTIQVGAVANAASADGEKFSGVSQLRKIIGDDGMTRFYSGIFNDVDESRKSLTSLREKGFKDAFICAFEGARRISLAEAGQLLKRK